MENRHVITHCTQGWHRETFEGTAKDFIAAAGLSQIRCLTREEEIAARGAEGFALAFPEADKSLRFHIFDDRRSGWVRTEDEAERVLWAFATLALGDYEGHLVLAKPYRQWWEISAASEGENTTFGYPSWPGAAPNVSKWVLAHLDQAWEARITDVEDLIPGQVPVAEFRAAEFGDSYAWGVEMPLPEFATATALAL